MSGDNVPSQSVARTLTVLETLVATDEGLTLTALAKATGIPLATCSAIAHTLEQRGYASRRIVGRSHFWRATMALYDLASRLLRKVDLASVARSELRELAHRIGMPVHVGVLNGSSVVYVAKATPPGFIQFDTYPGKVAPFNLTALGKAISAHLDEDELRPLLDRLVVGSGPGALAGEGAFGKQLATVRRKGYAFEREEEMAEVSCVAVPFFDADDRVAGAVGATGFTRDLRAAVISDVADGLRAIADHISSQLGRRQS